MKNILFKKQGFALLYAILISGVIALIGVLLVNIITKQLVFSSLARDSEISYYYLANSGRECLEYNLSHIGYTLSHEMSHALDESGSKYDHLGNLNDWWTKEDKIKYKRIIRDIIHQYEVYASYDGIDFDAENSIGEDMADISGLAICEEYLRDFHMNSNSIVPIVSLSFQSFFIYFALQNRQHVYKKAIAAQLKTNPHPMDKYRTNVPLSRLELFRSLYNVKKGDKMWWNSTSTIW